MADATLVRVWDEHFFTLDASVGVGEIYQLPDGRAGYYSGSAAANSGTQATFRTSGKVTVTKATGVVILPGGRVYWDHSANNATYKKVNDRDFYIGRAVGPLDAGSADATLVVDLNVDPPYDIDLLRDGYASVPVGTQALGGFLPPQRNGGALHFTLSATSEAQKVDALSVDRFALGANAIAEFIFRVINDGGAGVQDASIGIANQTHATDADSIAESVFIHLDGNNTNINAESDDGTTEVAATDTTTDYTEGSAVAQRVEVWMDFRNPADVQIYVNGALVLASTVFNINAATGPLGILIHLEKTSSADVYELAIDAARVRLMEQ